MQLNYDSQVTYKTRLDEKHPLTVDEAVSLVKDAFVTAGEVYIYNFTPWYRFFNLSVLLTIPSQCVLSATFIPVIPFKLKLSRLLGSRRSYSPWRKISFNWPKDYQLLAFLNKKGEIYLITPLKLIELISLFSLQGILRTTNNYYDYFRCYASDIASIKLLSKKIP